MAKILYSRDEMGGEVQAPWGYYQPLEEDSLEYGGRRVLYTLGSACVEVSCCGHGSWEYARVEGYMPDSVEPGPDSSKQGESAEGTLELDPVEGGDHRAAIAQLIGKKHAGVRVEFR